MICYIDKCIRVHYNATAQLLHYSWCGDAGQQHKLRPALEQIVLLVEKLQIRQCLLDVQTLPIIGIEDQWWLLHTWLPKVCMPTVECVALIVGPRQYNLMVIESILRAGRQFIRFDVQLFSDLDAAFDWLVSGRDEVAQLLMAEWQDPEEVYNGIDELLARALPLCR